MAREESPNEEHSPAISDGVFEVDEPSGIDAATEIELLRRRLADTPRRVRQLEERLLETKGLLAQESSKNERLSSTLREARENISTLREEVGKLSQPPSAYGVVVG